MGKNMLSVIIAELKGIFSSKGIMSVLLIGPIIYFVLYPQPYLREVLRDVPITVIDQDNTTLSQQLIRDINATDAVAVMNSSSSMQQAKTQLEQQKIYGIVVIPLRFEQQVLAGNTSPISFYGDASYILIYNNIATAINSVSVTLSNQIAVERQIAQGVDPAIAQSNSLPFTPNMIALFNPQAGYATYVIPPVFILILHQILFISILISSYIYRQNAGPLIASFTTKKTLFTNTFTVIIGKIATYLLIYTLFYWLYIIMIHFCYDIPNLANSADQFILGILFIIATITFALALSLFIKRIDDIFLLIVPLSMIIFFLSGVSWPKELIPDELLAVGHVIPAVPAMIASTKMTQMGTPFALILPEILNLVGLVVIYLAISLFCYHREIKKQSPIRE